MSAPIYFVTVDNSKDKANGTFGTIIKDLSSSYALVHVANCETISSIKPVLSSLITAPQLLITSSDWFEDEQEEIREIAQRMLPGMHLIMTPPGLVKQEGEEKGIEYLKEQISESKFPTRA